MKTERPENASANTPVLIHGANIDDFGKLCSVFNMQFYRVKKVKSFLAW